MFRLRQLWTRNIDSCDQESILSVSFKTNETATTTSTSEEPTSIDSNLSPETSIRSQREPLHDDLSVISEIDEDLEHDTRYSNSRIKAMKEHIYKESNFRHWHYRLSQLRSDQEMYQIKAQEEFIRRIDEAAASHNQPTAGGWGIMSMLKMQPRGFGG
jgi:hypothetical protein